MASTDSVPASLRETEVHCQSCHQPHPRWGRITTVIAGDPKRDGPWRDLHAVARGHIETTGCRSCHGRTGHGSTTLWAQPVPEADVVVDGRGEDPAWDRGRILEVPVMGGHTIGRITVDLAGVRASGSTGGKRL